MYQVKDLEKIGFNAVMRVRKNTLSAGRPFMIKDPGLPVNEFYLEHPDGSFTVSFASHTTKCFKTVRPVPREEANRIRAKYRLQPL